MLFLTQINELCAQTADKKQLYLDVFVFYLTFVSVLVKGG